MAKNTIRDFSATASANTDIQSVNVDENCAASGINNAIRELMADLKDVSTGTVALETPQADSLKITAGSAPAWDTNTRLWTESGFGARYDSYQHRFDVGVGRTQAMSINASGLVGVGTASPSQKLTISGTANNQNSEIKITAAGVASGYLGSNSDGLNIGTDSHNIVFKTGVTGGASVGATGTERVRILSSGGITFNGDTSSANALDDYEEGTWAPSFNLVTVTHTAQYGRYVKIGKMVHLKGYISVSSIDNTDPSGIQMTVPISANSANSNGSRGCTFAHDAASSTLLDGSHASVQGAYVSGTTFAITNTGGGNFSYNQLTQSSGVFIFALTYEAA